MEYVRKRGRLYSIINKRRFNNSKINKWIQNERMIVQRRRVHLDKMREDPIYFQTKINREKTKKKK